MSARPCVCGEPLATLVMACISPVASPLWPARAPQSRQSEQCRLLLTGLRAKMPLLPAASLAGSRLLSRVLCPAPGPGTSCFPAAYSASPLSNPQGSRGSVPDLCVLVTQSRPALCDPVNGSPPGSSVLGFSRQEHWRGLLFPSPGDLPDPGIEPVSLMSPALAGRFFTTSSTWET